MSVRQVRAVPNGKRTDLVDILAAPVDELAGGLGDRLARALYWSVFEQLESDGMDALKASRIALRTARLAVLRAVGVEQRQAAEWLEVSRRTVELDAARVRAAVDCGAVESAASRRLPRVPVAPDNRVRTSSRARARRAS